MTKPNSDDREIPEQIWWCFTCVGGVGVWGVDSDKPPPRCPECHGSDFAPVKFVPQVKPRASKKKKAHS